jgi:hypothetical protein
MVIIFNLYFIYLITFIINQYIYRLSFMNYNYRLSKCQDVYVIIFQCELYTLEFTHDEFVYI